MGKQLACKRFVVFDADGTLFNTMPGYRETFSDLVHRYFDVDKDVARRFYFATAGMNLKEQFRGLLRQEGKSFTEADIAERYEEFFEMSEELPADLFNDVRQLLDDLKRENVKMFITSGTKGRILHRRLRETGLLEYFTMFLGSDDIPKGGAHITIFAEIIDVSFDDFTSQGCLVGDGSGDMKLARKAKMLAIGITRTVSADALIQAGADIVISSLSELVDGS
ncbi:MAG: HAD family phosphatase [Candidatus Paceibacterota bacterium]|jgi:phosphoglycolate phosphatase-like HAD superfamily hydrolase